MQWKGRGIAILDDDHYDDPELWEILWRAILASDDYQHARSLDPVLYGQVRDVDHERFRWIEAPEEEAYPISKLLGGLTIEADAIPPYSAKDEEHNNTVAQRTYLKRAQASTIMA